jgi:hypothetical protein
MAAMSRSDRCIWRNKEPESLSDEFVDILLQCPGEILCPKLSVPYSIHHNLGQSSKVGHQLYIAATRHLSMLGQFQKAAEGSERFTSVEDKSIYPNFLVMKDANSVDQTTHVAKAT